MIDLIHRHRHFLFVSIIWAWTGVERIRFFREQRQLKSGVIQEDWMLFILNVGIFTLGLSCGVGMQLQHRPPSPKPPCVPYVAAIVGAILAVVCLIAWALN